MTPIREYLATLPNRCAAGFAPIQHPRYCACRETPADQKAADYAYFKVALVEAVRADGTVHACDVRPLTRGRIPPRQLSRCWGRAISEHVLVEAGHERSNDVESRNSHRLEPYYELRTAA